MKRLLAKIHIAKKELGLDEETYRTALEAQTGKRSAAKMSEREIIKCLNHFVSCGWVPGSASPNRKKYSDSPRDPYDASGKIKRKIEAMWHDLYRGNDKKKHLRQWLFNHFHISDVQFLDKRTAYDAVEALKAMSRHRGSKVESPRSEVGAEKS